MKIIRILGYGGVALTTAALTSLLAGEPHVGPPVITGMSRDGNNIVLDWNGDGNRYILKTAHSLTAPYQFQGPVLASNGTAVAGSSDGTPDPESPHMRFFRVRKVNRIIIPDPNLEAAVKGQIPNKFENPKGFPNEFYDIDTEQITYFNGRGRGIVSLEGIECLVNATNIDLSGNGVVDVTPIGHLKRLLRLNLSGNRIVDPSSLAGLPRIAELNLSGNLISDESLLEALLNRGIRLNLEGNPVYGASSNQVFLSDTGEIAIDGSSPADGTDVRTVGWTYSHAPLGSHHGLYKTNAAYEGSMGIQLKGHGTAIASPPFDADRGIASVRTRMVDTDSGAPTANYQSALFIYSGSHYIELTTLPDDYNFHWIIQNGVDYRTGIIPNCSHENLRWWTYTIELTPDRDAVFTVNDGVNTGSVKVPHGITNNFTKYALEVDKRGSGSQWATADFDNLSFGK